MIKVDANLFRLAYGAVSTEETRYYLNGVHIEPHPTVGALLVSTDGHRAIVAYDPDGVCDQHVIVKLPGAALAQCKPDRHDSEARRLVVDAEANTATLELAGKAILVSHEVLIDGSFPDWRRVVPKEMKAGKAAPTTFAANFLSDWGKLGTDIKKTVPGASGIVRFDLSDGASPAIIRFGTPNVFAILMPVRGTIKDFLPPFMGAGSETQEQAA